MASEEEEDEVRGHLHLDVGEKPVHGHRPGQLQVQQRVIGRLAPAGACERKNEAAVRDEGHDAAHGRSVRGAFEADIDGARGDERERQDSNLDARTGGGDERVVAAPRHVDDGVLHLARGVG